MMVAERWAEIAGAIEGWIASVPEKTAVGGGQGVDLADGETSRGRFRAAPGSSVVRLRRRLLELRDLDLPIFSIAAMTRCDFSRSGSPISS